MIRYYAYKLAELVLKKGVNLEKGQCVCINTTISGAEYAEVMAAEAYRLGARYVDLNIKSLEVPAVRSTVQEEEELSFVPTFLRNYYDEMKDEKWARISIVAPDDEIRKENESNPKKMAITSKAVNAISEAYFDDMMKSRLSWCVCTVPGPVWARKVLGDDATEEDLAAILSSFYRFDTPDFMASWDEFDATAKKRMDRINNLGIKTIHYSAPGTDLTIGLRPEAIFEGGSEDLPNGRPFMANLPTEEIFSCPDRDVADGYFSITRPVSVMNRIITDAKFYFKDGVCYKVESKDGQAELDTFLEMDEGSRHLGECALVDHISPISNSGHIFYEILLDENASCHLALGAGYATCLKGGADCETEEDLMKMGINDSINHTDFMIGSDKMNITAETYDGKSVTIMENGSFVF